MTPRQQSFDLAFVLADGQFFIKATYLFLQQQVKVEMNPTQTPYEWVAFILCSIDADQMLDFTLAVVNWLLEGWPRFQMR
jgi:hypothetical protein